MDVTKLTKAEKEIYQQHTSRQGQDPSYHSGLGLRKRGMNYVHENYGRLVAEGVITPGSFDIFQFGVYTGGSMVAEI